MKNIFNKMVELEEIEKNPIAKHKLFNKDCSRVKHLTVEQLKKLYAECCDHLLPVVIMAVNTGCRKSEILNLKWKDVDFIKNKIYITNTKSGKNRFVPIANQLKETLLKIKQNTKNKNYVFCDVNGAPLGRIETAWRAACRRAGITDFRVHDLRHHYSITMVSNGMDLISLKQFLGHSSLQMVERYANYIPDRDAKAINILNSQMVIF